MKKKIQDFEKEFEGLDDFFNESKIKVRTSLFLKNDDPEFVKHRKQKTQEASKRRKIVDPSYGKYEYIFISPGIESAELYDMYNQERKSNQKMPVNPSLIYFFRKNNFKAADIKKYCIENNIYHSTDPSYWNKLAKHKYPWYSETASITYRFSDTLSAIEFLNKTFNVKWDMAMLHQICSNGYKKHRIGAGWIFTKEAVK